MNNDLKSLIILFKAHESVLRNIKISLKDTGLNVNEFTAMEALYVKKKLTTQALIDVVLIPNSSMSYILKTLDEKKCLRRQKDKDDQRIQYISLTAQGRRKFEEVYEKHFEHMRSVFNVLDETEEKQLQFLLKKLGKEAMERYEENA